MNETLIIIVGVALAAGIIAWLLRRTDLSWDTPARPITLTSKLYNTRCDRIIHYLNQIGAEIQQSGRSDTADIQCDAFQTQEQMENYLPLSQHTCAQAATSKSIERSYRERQFRSPTDGQRH